MQVDFIVPDMHCGGCVAKIERVLKAVSGVAEARANLTARRVRVDFDPGVGSPDAMLAAIERAGYQARPFDFTSHAAGESDATGRELVRALAVAGFAAGNIMLLSVSVWSGATDTTRDLFHWVSALIALPAIVYSGRPFFRSAWRALRARSLNMDVPISLGVILAAAMSLYETATSGEHAWFDAAITLLFFLLVGRFLDHRMRNVARSAAARLLTLAAPGATRINPDGTRVHVPMRDIVFGDMVQVAPGERVPVDGVIAGGRSDIDLSMLTGEADPQPVREGGKVFAGTFNLTGLLTVRTTARAADTLLAEIARLMESAERSKSAFVRLADRASRIYAPFVHLLAAATLVGWLTLGAGWHNALAACVAVLIITCPCALGLAVPAVQVVASGFLLRRGIMLKDGAALEKLAGVDTVIFDKTGTLTENRPHLVDTPALTDADWALAAALAGTSRHPLARALAQATAGRANEPPEFSWVKEVPGCGVEAEWNGSIARLGRREWVGGADAIASDHRFSEVWLRVGQEAAAAFRFAAALRPGTAATIAELRTLGIEVMLLSGDREEAVADVAARAGVRHWRARCLPTDKAGLIAELRAKGHRVLMVGDGINDAPALASAAVSMSPADASDFSQNAAGIVFTGRSLAPVAVAIKVARAGQRLILQNFALAIAYNLIAVPIAMAGLATPLIAAIAMSTSSLIVTANALRLPLTTRMRRTPPIQEPRELQEAAA
jgi:Cu2+-exporting ATPase